MALYYDAQRSGPSLHALVIGVGGYTHLNTPAVQTQVGLLDPLTSPPRSALAFARFLKRSTGWATQLDTIDLLISPNPADAIPVPPQARAANQSNIQQAFTDWETRCNADPDHVALFYFCGHGLEHGSHYLLAEDFGANTGNPWLGAFDFDRTRLGFHKCQAKTQLFFVDACRKLTAAAIVNPPNTGAMTLVNINSVECRHNLTIKGAARNEAAFGPKKAPGVAYFTRALIRSLNGGVAVKRSGQWTVQTGDIAANINPVMAVVRLKEAYKQRFSSHVNTPVTVRTVTTPKVKLTLECNPESAKAHVTMTCNGPQPPDVPKSHSNLAPPWKTDVDAGIYKVDGTSTDPAYSPRTGFFTALPPATQAQLECQ